MELTEHGTISRFMTGKRNFCAAFSGRISVKFLRKRI